MVERTFEASKENWHDEELLRKKGIAGRCNVCTREIVEWQSQGLPYIKISSRLNLYRWGSVREWLRKREVRTVRPGGAS